MPSNFPNRIDEFPYEDPATAILLAIEEYVGVTGSSDPSTVTGRLNTQPGVTGPGGPTGPTGPSGGGGSLVKPVMTTAALTDNGTDYIFNSCTGYGFDGVSFVGGFSGASASGPSFVTASQGVLSYLYWQLHDMPMLDDGYDVRVYAKAVSLDGLDTFNGWWWGYAPSFNSTNTYTSPYFDFTAPSYGGIASGSDLSASTIGLGSVSGKPYMTYIGVQDLGWD